MLKSRGYESADPYAIPTFRQFGFAALDHTVFRPNEVTVERHTVHSDVEVSDHLPISTRVAK